MDKASFSRFDYLSVKIGIIVAAVYVMLTSWLTILSTQFLLAALFMASIVLWSIVWLSLPKSDMKWWKQCPIFAVHVLATTLVPLIAPVLNLDPTTLP